MAGLPGAGKDTRIKNNVPPNMPVLSLDNIRRELGITPTNDQSAVIRTAKERAKTLLRAQRSFVWNATNISKPLRASLVDLFTAYAGAAARVRIVYVHAPLSRILEHNRRRNGEAVVPEQVIRALHARLDVPDPTEAHRVEIACSGR